MTNNLNTIEGAQQEVIDQFEYNLQAKGVLDAQFNPTTGLLGLINRIPDIEPSTNINLNITLTLTSAEPSVDYGGSILLSATLMASYEGASDVDLKTGEITGATITFKKGGSIIGTSITDNNGVATLLYTPVVADCDTTLNLSAVFSGTDNFNSANSNNINVDVNGTLELTSDKDILSYADNEYATLTATLNSADKNNKEVIFEVRKQSDDSLVETLTGNTDSSGNATVYYLGKGTGDLYIQAFCSNRMISSESFVVEDCRGYRESIIWTPTSNPQTNNLFEIDVNSDVEITGSFKSSNKGFGVFYSDNVNSFGDNYLYVGVDGGNYYGVVSVANGSGINHTSQAFKQYVANSVVTFSIKKIGNTVTITEDNLSYTFNFTPTTLKYIALANWNNTSKTLTISDLKVKSL